jgi:hypothetical protein
LQERLSNALVHSREVMRSQAQARGHVLFGMHSPWKTLPTKGPRRPEDGPGTSLNSMRHLPAARHAHVCKSARSNQLAQTQVHRQLDSGKRTFQLRDCTVIHIWSYMIDVPWRTCNQWTASWRFGWIQYAELPRQTLDQLLQLRRRVHTIPVNAQVVVTVVTWLIK